VKPEAELMPQTALQAGTLAHAHRSRWRAHAPASFSLFFRRGWHVLESVTPLIDNWHVDTLCDHLQALVEDWHARRLDPLRIPARFQNLLVNIPPGTAKSRIASVYWPAWVWTRCPEWRVLAISGNPRVSLRDADFSRKVIESPSGTRNTSTPDWVLDGENNAKSNFKNTKGGQRLSFGAQLRCHRRPRRRHHRGRPERCGRNGQVQGLPRQRQRLVGHGRGQPRQ
jgi:hypothetical protein